MRENPTNTKILKILLKDFTAKPTITFLAKEMGLTRVGVWKIIKKLEKDKLVILSHIGTGKTSISLTSLNWENPLVEKIIALVLIEDALKNQIWRSNFAELEGNTDFLVLYGSILHSSKDANDIDILTIVSNKKKFLKTDEIIRKIQKTQVKKIHSEIFTIKEFKEELQKPNKIFVDAVKKGIVLFGQEKFIQLLKTIKER
ncbi:MAG: HTH domain-containing protein [Nanoarchaeota archaeon]